MKKQNKKLIIVLAGGINKNGSLKKDSKSRVKKAVEVYKKEIQKNENIFLVVSGSWSFLLKYKPKTTEAKVMMNLAVKLGVPKNKILLEEKSNDTIGNAYFTKIRFVKNKKWDNILVLTSKYHLKRTKYIFRKVFGDKYKIKFIGVDDCRNIKKYQEKVNQEERFLKATKKWFGKVKKGNDKEIKNFLFSEHPGYSKNNIKNIKL